MTRSADVTQASRPERQGQVQHTRGGRSSPAATVGRAAAVALASLLLTGCGFLFFREDFPQEIVVDNRTDVTLTATYRGRVVELVPPHRRHSMHPGPVEGDSCLIAPMLIVDESNTHVAQVDEGECYKNDRITIVIEQDDLP